MSVMHGKRKDGAMLVIGCCAYAVGLSLLVRLLIWSVGPILSLFDASLAEIFSAWRHADVDCPVLVCSLCGVVLSALTLYGKTRAGRHGAWARILTYGLLVVLCVTAYVLTLWMSKINGIPVSVLAEIIVDLVDKL